MQKQKKIRRDKGFTLVELLLVLVILALIAGLVLPGIIGKAESAKSKAAALQVKQLVQRVDEFYLDTGKVPSSLDDLVSSPGGVDGWNGPYVQKSSLKDPWGRAYEFRSPGDHDVVDIWSFGADGQMGGDDAAKDINSWE
jgi:general secretion pathway protein G